MKQEEDFDANLAGEEATAEEVKKNWFKRMKKGILTSTKDKKSTFIQVSTGIFCI